MKYKGKLYGKIEDKYVELHYNGSEIDILENKIMMLVADVNFLEKQLKELKGILDARDNQVVQILDILNKRLR
jgi:peptidoglycan hydrolase CwlO-like protein